MESCLLDLAKNEVQSLVNLVKNEAQFLCCFNSYVENFEQQRNILAPKLKDVKRKFQKGKGVYSFKFEAEDWERDADDIMHVHSKIKKKLFFGWCPNCWWQYRRGKELAGKTQHIKNLLERCNSNIVAGRANVLDTKYLSSQGFIHFESRESKFQDLLKTLQDENCNMIGLQGLGGTGKTSMAKEVGHKLKESKFIDKFIFLVVSQPPDFKKIRGELAKSLDLNLDEVKEEELSSTILSRITNMDEKLLIILDDVWAKIDLTEKLGIPFGHQHKGCNLLITTRSSLVCREMGCQMIQLQTLTNEEASNLFEAHASLNSSHRGFKGMAQKIVKHCGGVPIAIVAVARALKNQPISVWKDALKTLKDSGLHQNLEEAYKCLKLSYDNLKNQKAKELLLISSLFPEDSEIPTMLLIKIGIGLGSFNENEKYHSIRSEVQKAIMELIYSSLLLNVEEDCVKLHDLVREVALRIGENDIQALLDLEKPIKGNLRYLFWKNDKFPDVFNGNQLEALSIFLNDLEGLNVTNTFFKEMTSLKVLVLANDERGPALSLTNSLQPLKFIQTLVLISLELGDISALGNLSSLITLWFLDCSMIELPKEFLKLKKLRSLEVERCEIDKNNPFEVVEMCSQLEELTFVGNECDDEEKDAISQNVYPLRLHRYYISSYDDLSDYFETYSSMSRYFRADELGHLVSDSTFKQLVGSAEVLLLEGEGVKRIWKNLVPDIVPIEKEGVMNDLIVLHLSSRPDIECLIGTKNHDPDVTAFCNLAELHLFNMDVEDLCRGPLPSGFLEQLEILKLRHCHELKSILFNGNYSLCHLKSVKLEDCPKLMSVFQPYTARSLKQLEELTIRNCRALEYIIAGEDVDSNQKSYDDSLFPSLKELQLYGVPSFIGIVREYHQLMSSSMHKPSPPLSRHNSRNLNQSLATRAFSWVQACCSLNKLRSTSKEINITISEYRSLDHTNPPGLLASKKWIDTAPTLMRQLVLHVCHIRKMKFAYFSLNSVSTLFTLSIASMISWEELIITNYDGLKHLVTSEEDDYKEQINCCSIFPKLQNLEIRECKDLEFLFLSTISIEIKNLKSLTIKDVPKLTYVVGKYHHENQNDELHFDLPSLEALCFEDVPEFISIGPMNFVMVSPSLQNVCSDEGHLNSKTTKIFDASTDRGAPSLATRSLLVQSVKNVREIKLMECGNIISLSTLSIAASIIALETLTIRRCHKLKCITTHEGDAQVDKKNCSIFPTLEKLEIINCEELEILFVSSISVGLEKLKSLTVEKVPKLKYVVGNYQKELYPSNQNQNDELCFNLPALETLNIENAPMINGICSKKYKLELSSLLNVVIQNCSIKSLTEEVHAPAIGAPLFHVTQNCLKTIREIELVGCTDIISLTNLSIASTILLEVLTIRACGQLKCIVADEGDARTQINYNSVFSKLKRLEVSNCDALEYLFPAYAFISPLCLESLEINKAPMLKYVFGRSQHDDRLNPNNQNIQTLVNFPVLKHLSIWYVPKLVGIYPENYYMRGSYLRSVTLKGLPEFTMRPFIEFLVCWHTEQQETKVIEMCWKTLEYLQVHDFKIEDIFDLTYMKTEKKGDELQPLTSSLQQLHLQNLSDLMNICEGPKCIICFDDLSDLTIEACKNLRVIFSASTVRSLPMLRSLRISGCEELVHIVEEDYETNADHHVCHEPCFPNLEYVSVSNCDKLKYLFSITISDILPELRTLKISEANELEHVLIKQDEMEEMFMKNVLPRLHDLELRNLPNLISVCHGINFQEEDYFVEVYNCPKFETSTTQYQSDPETENSQVEEKVEESLLSHMGEETQQSLTEVVEARAKGVSSNTLDQISLTSEKEVPIRTSLSLTVLPTRDNTHACANIYEEEEEELGGLITSRRLRSGIKASGSLSEEKLETFIDGEAFALPVTNVLNEQTSPAILPVCPMSSKASTSLNQTPSILSKASDDDDVQVYDKSHPHSTNLFDVVDHGDIKEAGMVQNEYKSNIEPSSLTRREQESSYSKGQIQTKDQLTDSQPRSAIPTTPFVTISHDEYSEIVEVRGEALILEIPHPSSLTSKEEPIPVSLNSTFLSRSPSTIVKIFEEEEKGGLITTPRHESDMKAVSSLPSGKEHKITIGSSNFRRGTKEGAREIVEEGIIFEEPKMTNLSSSFTDGLVTTRGHQSDIKAEISLLKEKFETPIHGDPNVQCTAPILSEQTSETILPPSAISSTASTVLEQTPQAILCKPTNDDDIQVSNKFDATAIGNVVPIPQPITQEIVEMMKLEGSETCLLEEALKTHPQLCLSKNDRSTQMMCVSYKVLIDILNILTTRTPFTITEADKRLLEEKLKDAYLLGFDKHWLDSIKTRVFNCDVSEVNGIQETLKGLESDLKTNETMLAATRNQEVESVRIVELAQKDLDAALQEHANVMANHTQLLKARQDILARQNQCWDMITCKNKPFGF